MSSLRRDLVDRRLWPVVVLLLAAIVAAALLLHHHATAQADSSVPPAPTAVGGIAPATSGPSDPASGRRASVALRRHLIRTMVSRDPFANGMSRLTSKPASASSSQTATAGASSSTSTSAAMVTPTPAATSPTSSPAVSTGLGASSSGSPAAAGSSTSTTSTTSTAAAPVDSSTTTSASQTSTTQSETTPTTAAPTTPTVLPSWTVYSVSVRVGAPGHTAARADLARLTPLPAVSTPDVMFMGVMGDGRRAVFSLGSGVRASGPGWCRPDHALCSAIVLTAGQAERLVVPTADGGTRTLRLVVTGIAHRVTHARADALAAYQRHSDAGLCELDLASPITYDQSRGSLSEVTAAACDRAPAAVPFPGPRSAS